MGKALTSSRPRYAELSSWNKNCSTVLAAEAVTMNCILVQPLSGTLAAAKRFFPFHCTRNTFGVAKPDESVVAVNQSDSQ